jgi:hypothetical protein
MRRIRKRGLFILVFLPLFLFLFFYSKALIADGSQQAVFLKITPEWLQRWSQRWFGLLNQRWLYSQEIAAYQYYHAFDPPEILTPATAPLVQYGLQLGLTQKQSQLFIQMIHRIDQRLQARWLVAWQQHGFNFDNGHFMDAPSLCLKQESLERQLLKMLVEWQRFGRFSMLTEQPTWSAQALLVPKFFDADRQELVNTIRMMDLKPV